MLKIRQSDYDAMRRHAEEAYPHECCGILVGTADGEAREVQGTVRCGNTRVDSPQNRYSIDPVEVIRVQREARERDWDIVGFYHSHPDHPVQWSPTDLQEAHWIGCSYVITSVAMGKAALTNSFALAGTQEENKRLVWETLAVE